MTPIPLTLGLIAMKLREFFTKRSEEKKVPIGNDDVKESESKQKLMINWNGNSCRSKGFSASSEMACSISTAFMGRPRG